MSQSTDGSTVRTGAGRRHAPGFFAAAMVYAVMSVAAFVFLMPITFMLIGSLKPDDRVLSEAGSLKAFVPEEASLQNYRDVFRRVDFGRFFFNSVLITSATVLGGLVVNSLAGYALARLRWRGRNAVFILVASLMIIPIEAIAVPLFYQVSVMGWRETYVGQVVPFVANAFSIYLFYTFFLGLPKQLEESGRMDGAGTLRTFWEVILPNSKPVFATVAVLTFLMIWGFYLWPQMVAINPRVRPLPVAIAQFQTLPPLQWGDILAFGVMMVAPVLVLFLALQRWFVRGVATSGVKG